SPAAFRDATRSYVDLGRPPAGYCRERSDIMTAGKHKLVGAISMAVWLLAGFVGEAFAVSTETVWQVGIFDESSGEFSDRLAPEGVPPYIIGKSTPKDWVAFQPGSANGRFGNQRHPRTIEFNLQE